MDRDMVEFVVIDQLVPKRAFAAEGRWDFTRLYEIKWNRSTAG